MFENIGEMVALLWRTIRALPRVFRQRQKIYDQLFEIGNASLLMACVLSLFIGGVIALQTGPVLAERGLTSAIGGLVGLSICKELAPVMMAILIVGRTARRSRGPVAVSAATRSPWRRRRRPGSPRPA